ncbi:hypothetical protein BDR03DRAFT_941088 [Suillus americanus]|nr:hypothetical protein BDR03DRAFT_941088 [Suillus americanus]
MSHLADYPEPSFLISVDQLEKANSPPIPEAYIYLLAVQCIVYLCEGLASLAGQL